MLITEHWNESRKQLLADGRCLDGSRCYVLLRVNSLLPRRHKSRPRYLAESPQYCTSLRHLLQQRRTVLMGT